MDSYCYALLVLVLFFLYIDNQNSVSEGYGNSAVVSAAPVADSGSDGKASDVVGHEDKAHAPVEHKASNLVIQDQKQYPEVGMKPVKKAMAPPKMMADSLAMVEGSSGESFAAVESAFAPLIAPQGVPAQIPADLRSLGSRVGGDMNVGDASLGAPVQPSIGKKPVKMGKAMPGKVMPSEEKGTVELHMIYAPWCGWSKKALPDFQKVEDEFHGKQIGKYNVVVKKHDSETPAGKDMAKKHKVRGFPTHFIMVEGKKIEDSVGRSYDELVSKIKELTSN